MNKFKITKKTIKIEVFYVEAQYMDSAISELLSPDNWSQPKADREYEKITYEVEE